MLAPQRPLLAPVVKKHPPAVSGQGVHARSCLTSSLAWVPARPTHLHREEGGFSNHIHAVTNLEFGPEKLSCVFPRVVTSTQKIHMCVLQKDQV